MALSKNAKATIRKLTIQGATEGERQAAKNALARLSDADQVGISSSIEVKLRRTKGDNSALTSPAAIRHFLKNIKGGEKLSYKELLCPTFTTADFYPICDTLIALGLAHKEGSRYIISKNYKSVFTSWFNEQIDSMRI